MLVCKEIPGYPGTQGDLRRPESFPEVHSLREGQKTQNFMCGSDNLDSGSKKMCGRKAESL